MNIKLLNREEIDDKRWNGCVHFALCATPYGYTWYLDNVCEEWEGLVYGNFTPAKSSVRRHCRILNLQK